MQNHAMHGLYTDDKNSNYSSNPNYILKSAKNFSEKLYTKDIISITATAEPFNGKRISNKQYNHCKANILLEKFAKYINSPTNIKSSDNDSLKAKSYKHFSNELLSNFY